MARVNIEDSLFKDQRWIDLVIELKSSESAMGALVWLWLTSQKYWKRDKSRIPKSAWDQQKLNPALIKTGWAVWEAEFNGYFAEGSDVQFAWLLQKQEAGKKGGETLRSNENNNLEGSEAKRSEAGGSAAKPPTPTPTPSPIPNSHSDSLSLVSGNVETFAGKTKKPKSPKIEDPNKTVRQDTWVAYSTAYNNRWKVTPDRNASVNSIIKSLVEKVGLDAPDLAMFYVSHNDSHYVKACHPMTLCLRDYVGLKTQMLRGKPITSADVRRLETQQEQIGYLENLKKVDL